MQLELIQILTQQVFAARAPKELAAVMQQIALRFDYTGATLAEFTFDKLGVRALIDTSEERANLLKSMLGAREVAMALDGLRTRIVDGEAFTVRGTEVQASGPHVDTWRAIWLEDSFIIPIREGSDIAGVLSMVGGLEPEPAARAALVHLAYDLLVRLRGLAAMADSGRSLSPRELEVMRLSSEGRSSKEIGEVLAISMRTVNAHVEHAITKLGARNRIQAIAELARRGQLAP